MKIAFRNKCMIQWYEEKIIVILREETVSWFKSVHFLKKIDPSTKMTFLVCKMVWISKQSKNHSGTIVQSASSSIVFSLISIHAYPYTWKMEGIKCRPSSCKYLLYSFLKAKGSNFPQIPFAVSYISVSDGINYECHNT